LTERGSIHVQFKVSQEASSLSCRKYERKLKTTEMAALKPTWNVLVCTVL
jgi:hypothetical protein